MSANKTTNHRRVSIGPKASAADDDDDAEGATSSSSEKKKSSLTAGRKRATTKTTKTRRKASSASSSATTTTTTTTTSANVIENLSEVRVKTRTKRFSGKHGQGAGSSSGEEEELLFERRSVFNPSGSHRMEIESKEFIKENESGDVYVSVTFSLAKKDDADEGNDGEGLGLSLIHI